MKNWYNEEKLRQYKELIKKGHVTQDQYDALETSMKCFNLDNEAIVDKAIDYLLSQEEKKRFTFVRLLNFALSIDIDAITFFDEKNLFELSNLFFKECKKEKLI